MNTENITGPRIAAGSGIISVKADRDRITVLRYDTLTGKTVRHVCPENPWEPKTQKEPLYCVRFGLAGDKATAAVLAEYHTFDPGAEDPDDEELFPYYHVLYTFDTITLHPLARYFDTDPDFNTLMTRYGFD